MLSIKDFFDIKELVCPHVYKAHKDGAWQFLDPRLLDDILFIRTCLGAPIYANSWDSGGKLSQRGLRCNLCQLVADKTRAGRLYVSAHAQGMALDFDVSGLSAERMRGWVRDNAAAMPRPCRLEEGVTWVHLDVRTDGSKGKVVMFKG